MTPVILPTPTLVYEYDNEAQTRREIERALEIAGAVEAVDLSPLEDSIAGLDTRVTTLENSPAGGWELLFSDDTPAVTAASTTTNQLGTWALPEPLDRAVFSDIRLVATVGRSTLTQVGMEAHFRYQIGDGTTYVSLGSDLMSSKSASNDVQFFTYEMSLRLPYAAALGYTAGDTVVGTDYGLRTGEPVTRTFANISAGTNFFRTAATHLGLIGYRVGGTISSVAVYYANLAVYVKRRPTP